ncbi:cyclase family protein [Streptomyces sp. NPDC002742]|uniref:cyclase family protein n=1 Tax=Streptomyces sp. NPDC002742 TaxID=3364663 RepID=UPI0036ABAA17
MPAHHQRHPRPRQSQDDFKELYARLAHLGTGDAWGALATITPERVAAAAREVRLGRTVTMAAPVGTRTAPDNPHPAGHRLTGPPEDGEHAHGLHFATDHFGMNVHGDADSHLDALCHVVYDGTLYGGVPASTVSAEGATALSVELVRDGIVGDGNNDTAPSVTDGVDFPVHVLGVHALGLHLLDYLQFEDLVSLCEQEGRWSFLCFIAPLRLPQATGSPVNPITIL